jgi:cytoskeletal protein CcmA (bactofilin family)
MGDAVLDLGKKKQRRTLDKVGGISTVIGAGAVFTGQFKGTENYVVYGTIEGDCDLEGTIVVEEGGVWRGQVKAGNVIVAGNVVGDVVASVKVELAPTARISGSIAGPVVAIAEGAVVEGKIRMTSSNEPVRFVERRTD